jgi:hypothetical protein
LTSGSAAPKEPRPFAPSPETKSSRSWTASPRRCPGSSCDPPKVRLSSLWESFRPTRSALRPGKDSSPQSSNGSPPVTRSGCAMRHLIPGSSRNFRAPRGLSMGHPSSDRSELSGRSLPERTGFTSQTMPIAPPPIGRRPLRQLVARPTSGPTHNCALIECPRSGPLNSSEARSGPQERPSAPGSGMPSPGASLRAPSFTYSPATQALHVLPSRFSPLQRPRLRSRRSPARCHFPRPISRSSARLFASSGTSYETTQHTSPTIPTRRPPARCDPHPDHFGRPPGS